MLTEMLMISLLQDRYFKTIILETQTTFCLQLEHINLSLGIKDTPNET